MGGQQYWMLEGIGKISQIFFGFVVAPGKVVTNLLAGGIAEAGIQMAFLLLCSHPFLSCTTSWRFDARYVLITKRLAHKWTPPQIWKRGIFCMLHQERNFMVGLLGYYSSLTHFEANLLGPFAQCFSLLSPTTSLSLRLEFRRTYSRSRRLRSPSPPAQVHKRRYGWTWRP